MQIFVSNQSLVLQKVKQRIFFNIFRFFCFQVTRTQAGNYTCHASNVEGDAESKPVTLTIMCKFYNTCLSGIIVTGSQNHL